MKTWLLIMLICTSVWASEINIAVAANVSYAIDELKAAFTEKYPGTEVRVTLGSSGKLTAQIKNGAPYGLFIAANMKYPEALYADKIAVTEPVVYAQGGLAFLSAGPLDFDKGITLLKGESVQKIAVANPKTAPYGAAAVEAMQRGGVYDAVKSKIVYAESVSQTVTYALTAVDVGIVAKASLYSPKMAKYKESVNWASVDPTLYTPIEQGIVLLKNGEKSAEYRAFYDFLLGPEAKAIFRDFGYIVP